MKRKTIYLIGIVIVLLICIIAYFMPLSLSDTISENNQIDIMLNEFNLKVGEPDIASVVYQDITTEQKNAILTLLEEYPYRRALDTLFSNGAISELGDKTLTIFVYDDNSSTDAIILASSGRIAVNDNCYAMEDAEQLIHQILEIVK